MVFQKEEIWLKVLTTFKEVVNYTDVNMMITRTRPDCIINLSGSFSNDYKKDYDVNVTGSKNILDSVLENKLKNTKMLFLGSSLNMEFAENPL